MLTKALLKPPPLAAWLRRFALRRLRTVFGSGFHFHGLVSSSTLFFESTFPGQAHHELHRFRVLPKRWIVERTFGWLSNYRRLAKDYEYHPASSEALILIAAIHLMARRLGK